MSIKWVTNVVHQRTTFLKTIRLALSEAVAVDIAVSYALLSGWELLEPLLREIKEGKVRMLITDQFALTQPEALRRALAAGVQLRSYGGRTYHPKVYLFYGRSGRPNIAILGSANLSESALRTAVEAGVSTTDRRLLAQLMGWFNELFGDTKNGSEVDDAWLHEFDRVWEKAAAARVRASGRQPRRRDRAWRPGEVSPENGGVLEDVFATIRTPIGVLSFDHAGNNVRNLDRALKVLARYPELSDKERSELHLLGFLRDGKLTDLGKKAIGCRTVGRLAKEWCRWLARQSDANLRGLNPRLASFKRAATRFWRLKPEVSEFFLQNLRSPRQRELLQTIELLCNGGSVVRQLSLGRLKLLGPRIMSARGFGNFVAKRVTEYQRNKGSRSWDSEDRGTVLIAWREITKRDRAMV